MHNRKWRTAIVAVVSFTIANVGFVQAAHAGIVETGALVQTTRQANMASIQAQLARDDVRGQLEKFGVEAADIEGRLAAMSDSELQTLAERMQETPAGSGALVIIGAVFVVLMILEFVGVIDIFKKA